MTMLYLIIAGLFVLAIYDLTQKKHTLLRVYPVIARIRFFSEYLSPKIHQYFFEDNHSGKPFPRSWRRWVYASSKREPNTEGFGSDKDFASPGHFFIANSMFPKQVSMESYSDDHLPAEKTIGQRRRFPYRPKSIVNISGMSFGALSAKAVESLNVGAKKAGCYHNTGEGGLSKYHLSGADVVFQFGTGYNGVYDQVANVHGVRKFSMKELENLCQTNPQIKMVEIKLHQGAKPGAWSILPMSKMTSEIAYIRGITLGRSSVSPGHHTAFQDTVSLLDFVEAIADATGLPVGIKCAVGKASYWRDLAVAMDKLGIGPDYIVIDGGEGGTGSATNSFVDHMGLPFMEAFAVAYSEFLDAGMADKVFWIGSGKLGLPAQAIKAMAMGCDAINVGREALMSIGCIQSQLCHTNRCPTGITTHHPWRTRGIDPALKSERAANYIMELRKEIKRLTAAAGYSHPSQFTTSDILINTEGSSRPVSLKKIYSI